MTASATAAVPAADTAGNGRSGLVQVLEADPDLLRALDDPHAAAEATRSALARIAQVPAGPWAPRMAGAMPGAIGLLVLDGLTARTVTVGSATSTELIGPGDLLRPWQGTDGHGLLGSTATWQVLAPVRVALLDRAFALAIAPWPELSSELYGRILRRSRRQAVVSAISHIRRVDQRLLAYLWHLADRWGKVTPDGVAIPVSLTHAQLAELVGAQRPSVTTALGQLKTRGLVLRRDDGSWTVTHKPRDANDPGSPG